MHRYHLLKFQFDPTILKIFTISLAAILDLSHHFDYGTCPAWHWVLIYFKLINEQFETKKLLVTHFAQLL